MFEYFRERQTIGTIILVCGFFGFGIYIGFHNRPEISKVVDLVNTEGIETLTADFSPFWKVWNNINEKYPIKDDTTDQEKIYGAI